MNKENQTKRKKCMYCSNYEGYYIKGLRHFESIKKGYCSNHCKIVSNNDGCECWKTRARRYYARKRAVSRALYEILMDISAIRQIMLEDKDEGDNL